ncbi:alaXL [Mucuna pruriens]|uniref:AlaXL n=1 Tax=Mucuna pruriens TaxID=157652 RepID=A0A371H8S2_MUCPR|nr:alaXL [Mucuna pruriens]
MDKGPTKLEYYDDMWRLQSTATLLSHFKGDDGRHVLILDPTIFYPQGGGQPADTGFVRIHGLDNKFVVCDVRSKDGIVFHYGFFENLGGEFEPTLEKGKDVSLFVDEPRRKLNSRLHSAGHLLDICLPRIGLGHLEPRKAYHFADGPWVEYKGTVLQNEIQNKQKDLELEANALISVGGKVSVDILPYDEAAKLCGGCLPDYVAKYVSILMHQLSQESTPRIVRIGDTPGCPCGGTHVADISDIIQIKVSQIRSKKGLTKVYNAKLPYILSAATHFVHEYGP